MSRVCEICGKKTSFGNQIARRGLPKKKGGIGLKTTGVSPRKFKPNIQKVRAFINGKVQRIRVCTSCLKAEIKKPPLVKKVKA
jgi:large subunit ribosomal protein L28